MKVHVLLVTTPDGPQRPKVYAGTQVGQRAVRRAIYRRVYRDCAEHGTEVGNTTAPTHRERDEVATAAANKGWWCGFDLQVAIKTVRVRRGRK